MNYVHNYDACVYRASTNIRNMGLHLPVGLESLLALSFATCNGSGSNGRACEIILPPLLRIITRFFPAIPSFLSIFQNYFFSSISTLDETKE